MKPVALITGASSGLGIDFAKQLSARGYHCVLTARDEGKLNKVQQELIDNGGSADIYVGDISDMNACKQLAEYIIDNHPSIAVLINNAGFGAHGNFQDIALDIQLNMIDLNCKSLLVLTHTLAQHMFHNKTKGYILNVASSAAFQPGPTMATYFATKAFVLSRGQALRFERKKKGVHVTTLCPGATKTAFFDRSKVADSAPMVQNMMQSDEVVKQGLDGLFVKKSVVIPGFMNKFLYYLGIISPTDIIMGIVTKMMKK